MKKSNSISISYMLFTTLNKEIPPPPLIKINKYPIHFLKIKLSTTPSKKNAGNSYVTGNNFFKLRYKKISLCNHLRSEIIPNSGIFNMCT